MGTGFYYVQHMQGLFSPFRDGDPYPWAFLVNCGLNFIDKSWNIYLYMHLAVLLTYNHHCAWCIIWDYYPTVYIRSNCLFFAMSWVTELFHRSIIMTIDWHYTMGLVSRFPIKNTQALIIMRDDDARTVRSWKETLCNNGENEAWFGIFKLQ